MSQINFNGQIIELGELKDQVLLHLLRQMTTSIDHQTEVLEKLNRRLDALEAVRQQQDGARMLVEWMFKYTPWIITILTLLATVFNFKTKGTH